MRRLPLVRAYYGLRYRVGRLGLGLTRIPGVRRGLWLLERACFGHVANTTSGVVDVELDGFRCRVPGPLVASHVHTPYEPLTTRAVLAWLPPGGVFVDVGANLGHFTLRAARHVGPDGHVHAIEPSPRNLDLLRANLAANRLANVTVHAVAATARESRVTLHQTAQSMFDGLHPHPYAATIAQVEVSGRPLDALIPGRVDLVKIDVEGAELGVLDGMARLLAEQPGMRLVVEWSPNCQRLAGHAPDALPERLRALGFHLRVIDDKAGVARDGAEVLRAFAAGTLPDRWYGNLLASRLPDGSPP